ncbi:hypothetical protein GF382_02940 [Candidatus Falkowbacteria bacterium]|nr:hypothetical protein [Candidatus Falkowbacteria bacterium]
MYKKNCTVNHPHGLNSRASSVIVRKSTELLRTYNENPIRSVYIHKLIDDEFDVESKPADPRSIIAVMMLAANTGAKLAVCTDDSKLEPIVNKLAKFIDELVSYQ